MRTVCQPIKACSQDLGNPAGRWNTISNGVTQTSLFRVQQRKQETSARRQVFWRKLEVLRWAGSSVDPISNQLCEQA